MKHLIPITNPGSEGTGCNPRVSGAMAGNGSWQLFKKARKAFGAAVVLAGLTAMISPASVFAQSADLDQIRNGSKTSPIDPPNWVNGNANATQAHYLEGHSIPYRMVVDGLGTNVNTEHELVIEWDIKHSGKHALDYVTQYQYLDPHHTNDGGPFGHNAETVEPLLGTGIVDNSPKTLAFPIPSLPATPLTTYNNIPAAKKVMTMFGAGSGNILSMSYVSQGNLADAKSATRMLIRFTSSNSKVVFAWGGHIATSTDWGAGMSAVAINGSPYHTRLISIDGKGGNQDRSLQAAAVIPLSPPDCDVSGDEIVCAGSDTVYYAAITDQPGISTFAWQITNFGGANAQIVLGANSDIVGVVPGNNEGSYRIEVTITKAGASAPSTCWLDAVIENPDADASVVDELTCDVTSVQLFGDGAGLGGSYHWTGPNNFESFLQNPFVSDPGWYYLTVTTASGTCSDLDSVQVMDISTNVQVSLGNDVEIACGQTEIEICPIVSPGADYNFAWTGPDNFISADSCITAMAAGTYIVVVTNPLNGCFDSDTIEVTAEVCVGDMHCTLTQGGWGNANGRFCDGPRRLQLINNLLAAEDLVIGVLGQRYIVFDQGEGQCLIDKLPAGGTATVLPAGAQYNTCAAIPTSAGKGKSGNTDLLSNGKFNNVLIGQVVALSLNMRLDASKGGNLGGVALSNSMTTFGATSCDENAEPILTDMITKTIPMSVINYLGMNNNVAALLALANNALGGVYVPSQGNPSYSDINHAVSSINELFDNCRILADDQISLRKATIDPVGAEKLVTAYPNPFSDRATIEFTLNENLNYALEVYDIRGSLVSRVSIGKAEAGKIYSFEVSSRDLPEGIYIVRLTTEKYTETIKLILKK